MAILKTKELTKRFGGTIAVDRCSINVSEGEILGIIGPNGSGKTTLFNLINAIYKPDGGSIYFKGESIERLKPYQIAMKGISRTFQVARVFQKMTVFENMIAATIQLPPSKKIRIRAKALDLLNLVGLDDLREECAGNLSVGQQRLLELARSLMSDPGVILLDEPTAGVHPKMIAIFLDTIKKLNREGRTFVIVEHNIPVVMDVCLRTVVMDKGRPIAMGTPEEIRGNEKVIEVYLGD